MRKQEAPPIFISIPDCRVSNDKGTIHVVYSPSTSLFTFNYWTHQREDGNNLKLSTHKNNFVAFKTITDKMNEREGRTDYTILVKTKDSEESRILSFSKDEGGVFNILMKTEDGTTRINFRPPPWVKLMLNKAEVPLNVVSTNFFRNWCDTLLRCQEVIDVEHMRQTYLIEAGKVEVPTGNDKNNGYNSNTSNNADDYSDQIPY